VLVPFKIYCDYNIKKLSMFLPRIVDDDEGDAAHDQGQCHEEGTTRVGNVKTKPKKSKVAACMEASMGGCMGDFNAPIITNVAKNQGETPLGDANDGNGGNEWLCTLIEM
jgi:hypothetical protein